jgi:heme-degrading monooxygenase HmoA
MFCLLFEVQIKEGFVERYLELAAALRPKLLAMGGCTFIDRFKSLTRQNLLLSYQIWRDESSLVAWRTEASHHGVQEIGREEVFSDYRIRIGQVIHERKSDRTDWRPARLTAYNDPSRRPPTYVIATESHNAGPALRNSLAGDSFESVYRKGRYAHLFDVSDIPSASDLGTRMFDDQTVEYVRTLEIIRDYGMYDRAEAPQYYPPATPRAGVQ